MHFDKFRKRGRKYSFQLMKQRQSNSSQKFPLISGMLQQFLSQRRTPVFTDHHHQQDIGAERYNLVDPLRESQFKTNNWASTADIKHMCEIFNSIKNISLADIINPLKEICIKLDQACLYLLSLFSRYANCYPSTMKLFQRNENDNCWTLTMQMPLLSKVPSYCRHRLLEVTINLR